MSSEPPAPRPILQAGEGLEIGVRNHCPRGEHPQTQLCRAQSSGPVSPGGVGAKPCAPSLAAMLATVTWVLYHASRGPGGVGEHPQLGEPLWKITRT